jgi:hypothetical protein
MPRYVKVNLKTSEAKRLCQKLLYKKPPGERVSPSDDPFIRGLFEQHPDYKEKTKGRAVSHFIADKADYGTTCFYAVMDDGERVKFSYEACIEAAAVEVPANMPPDTSKGGKKKPAM